MQPDLVVSSLPVAGLVPYAENARTHSPSQVAQIAASIAEFGFVNPVLVDAEGVLIAGHGRVMAAKQLGLASVPVLRLGHLSPAQARALRLADNQISLNSGWDEALLAAEIARIRDEALVDLDVLGFSGMELDRLLAAVGTETSGAIAPGDPDAPVPEPPEDPVTRPGDLWRLGQHRLLCGDATSATDVARLLGNARPHLMATDPPYGVNYDPGWRNEAGVSATMRTGKVANDDRADWRAAWALFPGDVAYVWHAGVHARTVIESLEAAGFVIRSQIVWAKPRLVLGRGDYHWQHEPCLYAVRKGATGHWQGARDQTTLWSIGNGGPEDLATVHGTQKPVECMRRSIVNNSVAGEAVYEPFCGSGTTIIAAETAGRVCLAMEVSPAYCDVAIERWQAMTGQPAVLDAEDRVFSDVAAARGREMAA
ncbi:methyltransferase [Siccirubricoccus deserti]|uniref:Methyltransferase n=1 Tax=Siccirubricoccus deserti TaxID=2013562 RepID=A0A9X0R487_9PROT|nr:DNA methyltransferase [Siccirubricoccus deserti]MBC4018262.1 site-specific DNA-methyltransferase [Siccirubricoccus deserti]GGC64507.1 methyltransferase [Siccirubricoccus deserti]